MYENQKAENGESCEWRDDTMRCGVEWSGVTVDRTL